MKPSPLFAILCSSVAIAVFHADGVLFANQDEKASQDKSQDKPSVEELKKKEEARKKAKVEQEKAVEAVKSLGGRVVIDYTQRESHP